MVMGKEPTMRSFARTVILYLCAFMTLFATSNLGQISGSGTGSPMTVTHLTNWTAHTFKVTAANAAEIGLASSPPNSLTPAATFTVPGKAVLVSPSGAIGSVKPSYTWNAVSNASWYYLWVDDSSGNRLEQWYSATEAGCSGGPGTCSVTPHISLAQGTGKWWVQTWNPGGFGPWSDPLTFILTPAIPQKPVLVSPSGAASTNTPIYNWNAVLTSTWYLLWVDDSTGNRINQWYRAAEAVCPNGTGTCSVRPDVALAQGAAKSWVQPSNENGYGPWSNGMGFTAPAPILPGKAVLVSPTGTIGTNRPTYSWNPDPYAAWYYLWANDNTGTKIQKWYRAADTGCPDGTGTCTVTPDITLTTGSGKWWIETWNANGPGPWSNGMTFSVSGEFFSLTSDAGVDGGLLPAEYTCDGTGSSPALSWSNAPAGAKEFALMMTTLPVDGGTKWNWVLYGIPGTTSFLAKNSSGVGIPGVGSHGASKGYQPPCSQGPGAKLYTFTLYALSASPILPSASEEVTGEVLSRAISSITLGSASLNLSYARP
jgi:phosphatidylethanolamine-binding protein (PEBP) family uncharacterized protein